jgi:hypothetical protein
MIPGSAGTSLSFLQLLRDGCELVCGWEWLAMLHSVSVLLRVGGWLQQAEEKLEAELGRAGPRFAHVFFRAINTQLVASELAKGKPIANST